MKPFTLLQSLYWQKEELHNAAWRLENKIRSLTARGKKATKYLTEHANICKKISNIEAQMATIERLPA